MPQSKARQKKSWDGVSGVHTLVPLQSTPNSVCLQEGGVEAFLKFQPLISKADLLFHFWQYVYWISDNMHAGYSENFR